MKNLLYFLTTIIALTLLACNDEETNLLKENPDFSTTSDYAPNELRSTKEALKIATNALSMVSDVPLPPTKSRSANHRRIDTTSPIKIVTTTGNGKARSGKSDTLMYVVNYADSMGYAIVSALRNTQELLAVTIAGTYNPDEPNNNPGFNMWVDNITQYLAQQSSTSHYSIDIGNTGTLTPIPMPDDSIAVDTIWYNNVPTRIKVYWGQQYPEGNECPNGKAGCSNTAVAMMMSYFRHPQQLALTYENGNPIDLNWDALSQHNSINTYSSGGKHHNDNCWYNSYPIHTRLAQLCRELGHRSNSRYLENGDTPTNTQNTMNTLKNLGYTNIQDVEYKFGEIDNHLSKNSILLMYGTDSNSGRAHMWICDGIKRYACKLRLYQTDNSIILLGGKHPWKFIREWQTEGQAFYFFNWVSSPEKC